MDKISIPIPEFTSLKDAIAGFLYLFFFFMGLGIMKLLKRLLLLLAPRAWEVIVEFLQELLVRFFQPSISKIVEKEVGERLSPSLEKIERATHGKSEKMDGTLINLIDTATALKDTAERLNKSVEENSNSKK